MRQRQRESSTHPCMKLVGGLNDERTIQSEECTCASFRLQAKSGAFLDAHVKTLLTPLIDSNSSYPMRAGNARFNQGQHVFNV